MDTGIEKARVATEDQGGMRRMMAATNYSVAGLTSAWRSEAAFRQEVGFALIMIPGAFWLATTIRELIMLIGVVLLVLIVELLNTAVEYTLDRIGTEHDDLTGRAKDMGSAAVFLSLLLCLFTWIGMLWHRLAG